RADSAQENADKIGDRDRDEQLLEHNAIEYVTQPRHVPGRQKQPPYKVGAADRGDRQQKGRTFAATLSPSAKCECDGGDPRSDQIKDHGKRIWRAEVAREDMHITPAFDDEREAERADAFRSSRLPCNVAPRATPPGYVGGSASQFPKAKNLPSNYRQDETRDEPCDQREPVE